MSKLGQTSKQQIASYIGIPELEISDDPLVCLQTHLHHLPPSILVDNFSSLVSPKRRATLLSIRNRRFAYTRSNPPEFTFPEAKENWPALWRGPERSGSVQARGENESTWVRNHFMQGNTGSMLVGRLPGLLREYEEERQSERIREIRRERAAAVADQFIPEEDSDTDEEQEEAALPPLSVEDDAAFEESEQEFEHKIKSLLIHGLLDVSRTATTPAELYLISPEL